MQKPTLAKGTRDFGPTETANRKHLFNIIAKNFKQFGYQEIETPAMENLSTLSGKYGEEGDTLLFKILDSGDYLSSLQKSNMPIHDITSAMATPLIASKGLRYDLTVPFARYVAMNRHQLSFPFKRFQMQPVWRADRPQKGRYREFWQCDADCIGSDSLVSEADFINLFHNVFNDLHILDYQIHVNNRKILEGIAEVLEAKDKFIELTTAIDKFDKIGLEGVQNELKSKGFSNEQLLQLEYFLTCSNLNIDVINSWKEALKNSPIGLQGLDEIETLYHYLVATQNQAQVFFDGTLARGLSYYTGCIFEVKVPNSGLGSIAAGGRYDNLTGIFGLPNVSGVGISFGADRIYDLLLLRNLFPSHNALFKSVLFCPMEQEFIPFCMKEAVLFRKAGLVVSVFPTATKLKKQLDYANAINADFAVIIGSEEFKSNTLSIKNLKDGTQQTIDTTTFLNTISK